MRMLHERLRDFEKEIGLTKCGTFNSTGYNVYALGDKEAAALADEIERDYIPKAVDSNGDVWNIGEECTTEKGREIRIEGYATNNRVFAYDKKDDMYHLFQGAFIKRTESQSPIEKVRDEIKDCAEFREHITYSLLDGWVKDLTAYIDQQGKDE